MEDLVLFESGCSLLLPEIEGLRLRYYNKLKLNVNYRGILNLPWKTQVQAESENPHFQGLRLTSEPKEILVALS